VPAGSITQRGKDWSVRLDNQVHTPEVLADVLVAPTPNGRVYLRDVATVVDTYKKVSSIQRTNGEPALGVVVLKQASANTVETADNVKRAIAQLRSELPPDLELSIVSDASVFTRGSIDEVQRELGQAVLLTGLVLLLFLHTLRSTAIVLLAIPTSLIATLGVMYFAGLSLNTMSLLAITLTVGILVDDSIVVLENIFRHLQLGETSLAAAINGRSEIGFAAIAITLVDVVVFAPIAFMSGPTGQYFRQFGLVVVAATLFSLLVSFTLTPMLASRWFSSSRATTGSSKNPLSRFGRVWDLGFASLAAGYGRVLRLAIGARGRWAVVGISIASFAAGVALIVAGVLSTEFMPSIDTGELQVFVEMPAGTSLEVTSSATQIVEDRILAWPEVEHAFTSVGVGNSQGASLNGPRVATITVQLLERRQRARTPDDLAAAARNLGADIPGARITAVPSSLFGANNGSNQIVVRVLGDDSAVLASLARQVAGVVRNTAGTSNVDEGGAIGEPQLLVEVDRNQAADLGLAPGDVASVLRTGLAGSVVSTFRPAGTTGWDIAVILNPEERQRVEQVGQIPILTPSGSTIQLAQIASVISASGPAKIYRRDRQRTVYVTALVNGRTTGDAAREIQRGIEQIGVPAGYRVTQAGAAQSQAEAFGQIITALVLSVVLMYMLMAALFESFTYPLMIMFSLPLAIVGALGALALTGNTLNMMSMIGQILLMGLVGKNAILLVDCTNTLRRQGILRDAALLQAGPMRLRPILMTTAALVLAMLPVAMKVGEGSEWRAPMAVTVIGGLLTSTLLTLVLIPAAYTLVDDAEHVLGRLIARVRLAISRRQVPGAAAEPRPVRTPIPIAGGSDD
jgi:hydrophobic/amphiphilic exporter-1 (mainly G- bacteria), HAE1 family